MHFIEQQIREILAKAIKKQAIANEIEHKDVQIQFVPFIDGEEIVCRYLLLIDYTPKEELSFTKIAGAINYLWKASIEQYIKQLYILINENENIELSDIRILIMATKNDPTIDDLKAFLYRKGELVRELEVSEFVG